MKGRLMIVGTASHAGKSVLVTALCRILMRQGVRVAPFKSQNMSLNSFVCRDGSEIGRAQVAQAEAAGLDPEADMNPILLKPTGNRHIQVVLQGRVHGTLTADEYYQRKPFFLAKALQSFNRLASKYDVVILEGAGSAAEVNLKDRDIVNLPFAAAVGSPAVLVADIDRGGVFASIVGTFSLLSDEERSQLRGFIINRFRGDLKLFAGGPEFLEKKTGRPCLGVMPYIESLRIDQEDSVSLEDHHSRPGTFTIGVIRLPHIANYTDFNPLEMIEGASLVYLTEPRNAPPVDLVIIPGTKNTIADLRWLVSLGFKSLLIDTLERGGWVLGVCGGFQMLGRRVSDPSGTEEGGAETGLDLLPIETELALPKITVQSNGRSFLGPAVQGYEIHMGRTTRLRPADPFVVKADGHDGAVVGRVAGTYFHGLFENEDFTAKFLTLVAESRGLEWWPGTFRHSKNDEYNRLAVATAKHLDMETICGLIERGGQI
jgi:adenosylcobyric acid synthase